MKRRTYVDVILLPRKFFIVGKKPKSGEIRNGAVGRVVCGQPLRVIKRERPGGSGYMEFGVENLLRRLGSVDINGDGPRRLILSTNE